MSEAERIALQIHDHLEQLRRMIDRCEVEPTKALMKYVSICQGEAETIWYRLRQTSHNRRKDRDKA